MSHAPQTPATPLHSELAPRERAQRSAMTSPLQESFERAFEHAPDVVASAPGRVNLLGEHTDYNGGFVLPTAIPQRTCVALAKRRDDKVQVWTQTLASHATFRIGTERATGSFVDYVQGVTSALRVHQYGISGFDAVIRSQVPVGSGLSSSAALAVALLRGLRRLFDLELGDKSLTQLAQWGENNLVGAPVGILDPMACHFAHQRSALFIDTRSCDFESLVLPWNAELVIVGSGIKHDNAASGHRVRRAECRQASRLLGVPELRDVSERDLERIERLPAPLNRRARHVVCENQRVLAATMCLRAHDPVKLGELFDCSHASMRDDFEISVPQVDAIVGRAQAHPRVFGARLTGGGFGGAIVCLVEREYAREVSQHLAYGSSAVLLPVAEQAS